MELIAITEDGELAKPMSSMPVMVAEVVGGVTRRTSDNIKKKQL